MRKLKKIGFKMLILALGIAIISIILVYKYSTRIYPKIYIENIKVSNLKIEEAKEKLHHEFEKNISNKKIEIRVEDKLFKTSYEELGVKFDTQRAIEDAINIGKKENFIKKLYMILFPQKINIEINLTYNNEAVDGVIYYIEGDVNIKPIESKMTLESNGSFTITDEENGVRINNESLKSQLEKSINKNINEEIIRIQCELEQWIPEKRKQNLNKINGVICSFSTSLQNSSEQRRTNIKLATKAVDSYVVMPNEIFSFNDVVGVRTESKGYKRAHVILGNQYVDDVGGGICQVSSTLYNAILKTDIEVIERKPHSKKINYVPLGQDATVNYGAIDFKFKNTLEVPIYIRGQVQDNYVAFQIYSDTSINLKRYQIESEIEEILKPKDTIKYSRAISKGQRLVEKEGKIGYVVNTYRVLYKDGKVVEKKIVAKDIYKAINNIVIVGI